MKLKFYFSLLLVFALSAGGFSQSYTITPASKDTTANCPEGQYVIIEIDFKNTSGHDLRCDPVADLLS